MPAWYAHESYQEMLSMVVRKPMSTYFILMSPCGINETVMASMLCLHPWQTIHVSIWALDLA